MSIDILLVFLFRLLCVSHKFVLSVFEILIIECYQLNFKKWKIKQRKIFFVRLDFTNLLQIL